MKIKPLFDRVLVKEIELEESSSLILQASSEDKPLTGIVIEAGDGLNEEGKQIKMQIKKGNKVIFSKYCAITIKIKGEEFFVLRQSDCLAILGDENE